MQRIAGRTVFTVGGRDYQWIDVILAAYLWGEYARLERRTREGLAWLKHLKRLGEKVPEAEADEAADTWRYDRDLLAADDLQQWLDDHDLDMDEWLEYIDRSVRTARPNAPKLKVSAPEVEAALYGEALCSGALADFATRLAGQAAAFDRLNEGTSARCSKAAVRAAMKPLPPSVRRGVFDFSAADTVARAEFVACLGVVFERFLDEIAAPAMLEREVDAHRLDWTRVVCETAPFATEEAAREAALLVREDSFPLADAAAMGKSMVTKERFVLADLLPPLKDRLIGARPGDLIAPVESNGDYLVVSVVDRVEPTTKDRAVRARAVDRVRTRTIQREIEKRVRWHERV
jgi:hypothetical protein